MVEEYAHAYRESVLSDGVEAQRGHVVAQIVEGQQADRVHSDALPVLVAAVLRLRQSLLNRLEEGQSASVLRLGR